MTQTINNKKTDVKIKPKPSVKKLNLSHKAIAHLETLKRYYSIDLNKRTITIPLHYKDVNEVVDESLGNNDNPFIRRSILAKISKLSHAIPNEFKINIDLKIDNYGGYKISNISRSILDAFEIFQYDVTKKRTTNALKVAALITIGVVIFAWLFYLCSKHWFGTSGNPVHDTVHELVYTVGGVVLWEAIYIIFLPSLEYDDISYSILSRINSFNLLDKNNKILQKISGKTMHRYWKVDTKAEKRARYILLITGTALMCIAGCMLTDVVEVFIKYSNISTAVVLASLDILLVIITILSAIGAISYFRDKGPFKKQILAFGIIAIVVCIFEIIFAGINFPPANTNNNWAITVKTLVLASLILAISITYVVCIIILKKKEPYKIKSTLGMYKAK